MKKVFLISVFLMLAFSYGFSQTYYYKAVAAIDKDGVRSKTGWKGMYITFTNNKSVCYQSDEKGNKSTKGHPSFSNTYYFRKTQNGTNVYQYKVTQPREIWREWENLYFSSDFSKLQTFIDMSNVGGSITRIEYIRTDGPEDDYDDNIPTF